MKKILVFLLCLLAFAKAYAQDSTKVKVQPPKIAVKLALGESVTLSGHTFEFVKVIEDSRCPKDVSCVWAGQAKVELAIHLASGEQTTQVILFNPGLQQPQILAGTTKGQIVIETLAPYPVSTQPSLEDRAYYVTLREMDAAISKKD